MLISLGLAIWVLARKPSHAHSYKVAGRALPPARAKARFEPSELVIGITISNHLRNNNRNSDPSYVIYAFLYGRGGYAQGGSKESSDREKKIHNDGQGGELRAE